MNTIAQTLCDIERDQGIGLEPCLYERLVTYTDPTWPVSDKSVLYTIADTLRYNQYRASQRPIHGPDLLTAGFGPRLARQLIDSPHQPLPEGVVNFEAFSGTTIIHCPKAEVGFQTTFQAIIRGEVGEETPGFKVFTHNGQPLLLRKAYNEVPSAISLREFAIHDVRFPVGSIVCILTGEERARRSIECPRGRSVADIGKIASIDFMRHSEFSIPNSTEQNTLVAARTALTRAVLTPTWPSEPPVDSVTCSYSIA